MTITAVLAIVAAHADETLTFQAAGKTVATFSKDALRKKIAPRTTTFFDPLYGKKKTYECLPIKEVMALAYGPDWRKSELTEVVMTALDGYASVADAAKLSEDGGCLALGDKEYPNWEPVERKASNPAPFYLSWSGENQTTKNDYPWPYQMQSINLVKFADRFPEVMPKGAAPDSPAYRGFVVFKNQCLRCHAINRQGGKIGPDLNAPQSVTAYHPKEFITAYIRQPSKFRYTEMPDHTHLSDADLENLYQYFLLKSRQPEKLGF